MGLDITAYSKLEKIGVVYDEDGEPIDPQTCEPLLDDSIVLRANDAYPDRAAGLSAKGCYKFSGCYGFRAGSYSSYNYWRDELAKLAGWALSGYTQYNKEWPSYAASAWRATGGPFWELINFSDCEGVIGPIACQKLAKDFADHQELADAVDDERFRELYADWRQAFEIASDGGAVEFH